MGKGLLSMGKQSIRKTCRCPVMRHPLLQNTWTSGIGPTLPLLNKHNILLSSASCISSQGCFPYLIRAFPAAVACGRISFPKIQSLKATQHPPQNHVFPGSLARNSPCIWSGLVFAGRTQHHGLFVVTRQPHALDRAANISDNGLAAEEIAVPLRCGGTTSREGLPIRNQSYGTWKGPRQILIHYDIMKLHSLARLNFSLVECYQVRANAGPEAGLRRGLHDCGTLFASQRH